ncbi:MAG: J domain-containing protein [Bacteroidia bacterium]|nr:J domain-containing protein [Bacteroidia bacterium]
MKKDYYEILNISQEAKPEQIKKAYHKLAKKYHPDKNPNDAIAEQRFKEISEAYEVLSDPEKREKYNRFGDNWKQAEQYANHGWASGFDFGEDFQGNYQFHQGGNFGGYQDFNEVFSQFFRNSDPSRAGNTASRGQDIQGEVSLSLEEVYQGIARIVQLGERKLKINIKPGSYDGQQLRIKGKGGPAPSNGTAGDLYVHIRILPHAFMERKGDDLYMDLPIDVFTAVLGGKASARSLNGDIQLNIPAGTESHKTLRLKGKGMPRYAKSDEFGDLYVRIRIKIPKDLTEAQREDWEKLKNSK